MSRVHNVRSDFGAIGNGTTDDTPALAAAISASSANGKPVVFPPGAYVTGSLPIPAGVRLQGTSGAAYLAQYPSSVSRLILKAGATDALLSPNDTGVAATGVRVSDLVLDTNGQPHEAYKLPDQAASVPRFWTMERCLAVNSGFTSSTKGSHVYIGNLNSGCAVRDCQLLSNAAGTVTHGAHGWDGIGWYGQDGLLDNTFVGGYGNSGIVLYGGSNDQTFTMRGGGTFWNTTGLVVGGTGALIDGVSVDHNYNDGVYAGFSSYFHGCTFHSNSLQTNNQWSHMRLAANAPFTVVGCRQARQDSDAGPNLAAYFINRNAGSTVNAFGNYQESGAATGSGWEN